MQQWDDVYLTKYHILGQLDHTLLQTFKHKRSLLLLKMLTEDSNAGPETVVLMDGECLAKPST